MRRDRDDWRKEGGTESVTAAATYYTEFTGDEPVTMAVVRAVSAVTGIEPTVLTPLGECIETDALEALFATPSGPIAQSFRFQYAGCDVTVWGDGSIALMAPVYD
jgi:hypothetical protein